MYCHLKLASTMYGGPVKSVTLQFPEKLIGVIYDKFGEDTVIAKHEDSTYTATIQVQESPTFRGWLHTFRDEMKIVKPEVLAKE